MQRGQTHDKADENLCLSAAGVFPRWHIARMPGEDPTADWSDSLSLSLFLSLSLSFGQCALALSTFLVRVIEGTAACLGRAPFYMRRQRERATYNTQHREHSQLAIR